MRCKGGVAWNYWYDTSSQCQAANLSQAVKNSAFVIPRRRRGLSAGSVGDCSVTIGTTIGGVSYGLVNKGLCNGVTDGNKPVMWLFNRSTSLAHFRCPTQASDNSLKYVYTGDYIRNDNLSPSCLCVKKVRVCTRMEQTFCDGTGKFQLKKFAADADCSTATPTSTLNGQDAYWQWWGPSARWGYWFRANHAENVLNENGQNRYTVKLICTGKAAGAKPDVSIASGHNAASLSTPVPRTSPCSCITANITGFEAPSAQNQLTAAPAPPARKIIQEITIASVALVSYIGDVKLVYEAAYAVSIGIWDTTTNDTKSGCAVTSAAIAARRTGVKITFAADVNSANSDAAKSASEGTSFRNAFVAAVTTANTALGKSVAAPLASALTVAAPTVSNSALSTGSCTVAATAWHTVVLVVAGMVAAAASK